MERIKSYIFLLLFLAICVPSYVYSATFTVNTGFDEVDPSPGDGKCSISVETLCSLRAAIMETNALANEVIDGVEIPDQIIIPDGTYGLTRRGSGEDLSSTGDLDITDSLIITGNTADLTAATIDSGGIRGVRDRVFHILSDNKSINVEFNYLTIKGGYASDTRGGGGGICIKCVASDAEAYQPTELGTMNPEVNTTFNPVNDFFNRDTSRPNVKLNHVKVFDNHDLISGAGIMNSGILTIEDSIISFNYSTYRLGLATGQNGQFSNNSQFIGGGVGGGISNWGGKLTIRRSIINNNRSQTGGGIYSQTILAQFRNEQVIIEDSQISDNTAFMGGGVFNVSGDWNFPERQLRDYGFILNQSTIDNNRAEFAGGGIYNLGLGAMLLSNVTVSNNNAADPGLPQMPNKGGGIYHSGKILDLVNVTIASNTAQNPRLEGELIADNATGGDEIFLDVNQANIDPVGNLPWRLSLLNSIVGDSTSTDVCNGTLGYRDFVTNGGGNVDESGTCFAESNNTILNGVSLAKPQKRSSAPLVLEQLANNGGLPSNELPDGTFPPTRALISGSALNAGLNCHPLDQRRFGRDETRCDAGAFQTESHTKGITANEHPLPIARDDRIITVKNVNILIPVTQLLANDNDPLARGKLSFNKNSVQALDQNVSTVSVHTGTQANNTGLIEFLDIKLHEDFVGETQVSYNISVTSRDTGDKFISENATINIIANDSNLAPVAYAQSFVINPGETLSSDLYGGLSNNSTVSIYDIEQSELSYALKADPNKGTVSINSDGSFNYTANNNAVGSDAFTYTVEDSSGLVSKPAVISVYLKQSNINNLSNPSVNIEAGKLAKIDLSNGTNGDFFFGLNRDSITNKGEILWLNERSGNLIYKAYDGSTGNESFNYTVVDLQANASANQLSTYNGVATVNIIDATTNETPVANSQELSVNASEQIQIYLAATDSDNDDLFFEINEETQKGSITNFNPIEGSLIYQASPHATGSDRFIFQVTDGINKPSQAEVTINLIAQDNQAPVANDDVAMTPTDLPIGINVLKNDTDDNGDLLSVSIESTTSQQGGNIEINENGILRYTPPNNFIGVDIIDYQVSDGFGGTASAKLKINVIKASAGSYQNASPETNIVTDPGSDETIPDVTDDIDVADNNAKNTETSSSAAELWLLFLIILIPLTRGRYYSS